MARVSVGKLREWLDTMSSPDLVIDVVGHKLCIGCVSSDEVDVIDMVTGEVERYGVTRGSANEYLSAQRLEFEQ